MLRWGRVEVTGGFLLLMTWLNYCDTQGLLLPGVCAAAAHEIGHWAVIYLCGGRVSRLRLSAVGAQMHLIGALSYPEELCCALAGPTVNLLLAHFSAQLGCFVFAGMNLALGMFNLLPIGPLDGGRTLRCFLSVAAGPDVAFRVQGWLDGVLAVVVMVLGMTAAGKGGGVTLCVIGSWLLASSAKKWRENGGKRSCQGSAEQVK